jgi:outer membrane protein OmpA-like peptidoglycan-associated protein
MNLNKINLVCLLFAFISISGSAWTQSLINKKAIENVELINEKGINTPLLEMSPAFYRDRIILVYEPQSGKDIDKETGDAFYNLGFAVADYSGRLVKRASFPSSINQKNHQGPASFSMNTGRLYFTRSLAEANPKGRDVKAVLKIYEADERTKFINPRELSINTDNFSSKDPSISDSGISLYFSSNRPGGSGKMDLFLSNFKNDDWEKPSNLGEKINSEHNEMFPFIYRDSILFFTSDRPDGYGGYDIYVSYLSNNVWSTPELLPEPINSPYDDFSFIIDKSGKSGYFSSNRPGGMGKDDIYNFSSKHELIDIQPEEKPVNMSFFVFEKLNFQPIEKAGIKVNELDLPEGRLDLKAYNVDLITGPQDGELILKLFPKVKGEEKTGYTHTDGKFEWMAMASKKYIVEVEHPGFEKSVLLLQDIKTDDVVNIPLNPISIVEEEEDKRTKLEKSITEGGKVYEFSNIYYDYNSAELRSGTFEELDELVDVLKKYPNMKIQLNAHTDSRGDDSYNLSLSKRRADSAKNYLVSRGVEARRVNTKGYGSSKLKNHCKKGVKCTEEEHQSNRRTEVEVIQ